MLNFSIKARSNKKRAALCLLRLHHRGLNQYGLPRRTGIVHGGHKLSASSEYNIMLYSPTKIHLTVFVGTQFIAETVKLTKLFFFVFFYATRSSSSELLLNVIRIWLF